jgi:hypothetical protein
LNRGLLALVVAVAAVPAFAAVNRSISISAPASAVAGSTITILVAVSTDAGGGEQIGCLHAQYSSDGGKTWQGLCFDSNIGPAATRGTTFAVGAAGSKALVRVRVAFRDGLAGDVDYTGAAIKWADSWEKWREPPTKVAVTSVVAP